VSEEKKFMAGEVVLFTHLHNGSTDAVKLIKWERGPKWWRCKSLTTDTIGHVFLSELSRFKGYA